MTLTIPGDTPAKKNSKQIIYVRGKPLIIPSKAHKAWHDASMKHVKGYPPCFYPKCGVFATFYSKTAREADLDNKVSSILDLLVDAGILSSDGWNTVAMQGSMYGGKDKDNPRCEVEIHEINQQ